MESIVLLGGGAINAYSSTRFYIYDSIFEHNSGREIEATTFLQDIDISFKLVDTRSGGAVGVTFLHTMCEWEIRRCVFFNNTANGGGALAIARSTGGLVSECRFVGNVAWGLDGGGAVRLHQSSPLLERCHFEHNDAQRGAGGAIFAAATAVQLDSCELRHNNAKTGGALYFETAYPEQHLVPLRQFPADSYIQHSLLEFNEARSKGGAVHLSAEASVVFFNATIVRNLARKEAGGILNEDATLIVSHSHLEYNQAITAGGALYIVGALSNATIEHSVLAFNLATTDGAAVFSDSSHLVQFSNCTVAHNVATRLGGGIADLKTRLMVLDNSTIHNNTASQYGGGIHLETSNAVISNCLVTNNTAKQARGGGLYFSRSSAPLVMQLRASGNRAVDGAAVRASSSSPVLIDCELSDNEASGKGGGLSVGEASHVTMRGCRIQRNTALVGGGVSVSENGRLHMIDTHVTQCVSSSAGAGITAADYSAVNLTACTVSHNAGALSGGMAAMDFSSGLFTGCSFVANTGFNGGALFLEARSRYDIEHTIFVSNSAKYDGGALRVSGNSYASLVDCEIVNNTATSEGAGIAVRKSSSLAMRRTLLRDNASQHGAGVFVTHDGHFIADTCTFQYVLLDLSLSL